MNEEYRQRKADKDPIDFNFAPIFVVGDSITSVSVTVQTGVTEANALRVVSGQTIQCRFDTHSATVGKRYTVAVTATTFGGDIHTLELDIIIID